MIRPGRFPHRVWTLLRDTVVEFFNDNALSRGAALAFYTVFALAPVLLIAIAVAGLLFGRDAAQGAIVGQLSGLMGRQSAAALQSLLRGAFHERGHSMIATGFGVLTLLVTATGVFVELQTSLNAIWKAEPPPFTTAELVRGRLLSLGLIGTVGFLLIVSLLFSALLQAVGHRVEQFAPNVGEILVLANSAGTFILLGFLFAAIYKVLPDRWIPWGDVVVGAVVTAILFTIGKFLISLYIADSAIASSYGSASSLIVLLLWIYYSAEIFLLGAEFTKVYAFRRHHRAQR